MRRALLLSALIFSGAVFNPALTQAEGENPEYTKALEITRNLTGELQSYELQGSLVMENKVEGQPEPMKLDVALKGAARWPDRLSSSQESMLFNLNLGLGPDQSWFYLGQAGACYLGKPLKLSRDLMGINQMELEESKIFNFFAGIGPFLLNEEVAVLPETGTETIVVQGKEISCQVFRSPDSGAGTGDQQSKPEGEQTFWFDPESGLVLQVNQKSLMMQQGMKIEQTMTFKVDSFSLNQPVSDDLFQYTPVAETRVVSSLDMIMNPDALTGETAAELTFTDFAGNSVQLSDYRGKVVFLDFWATWCGPCRMEMPHIQKLHEELGAAGDVVFLGASSEPKATIEAFLGKNPYSFKILMVKQEDAQKKFKVTNIPAGFVIDRQGVIRAHLIGAQTEDQLRQALAKAGI